MTNCETCDDTGFYTKLLESTGAGLSFGGYVCDCAAGAAFEAEEAEAVKAMEAEEAEFDRLYSTTTTFVGETAWFVDHSDGRTTQFVNVIVTDADEGQCGEFLARVTLPSADTWYNLDEMDVLSISAWWPDGTYATIMNGLGFSGSTHSKFIKMDEALNFLIDVLRGGEWPDIDDPDWKPETL